MPIPDIPVHEKTRQAAGSKPGCFNRGEYSAGYYAPDREYAEDGTWKSVQAFVPHRMSTECRFDQAIAPERCEGCKHLGSGKAYDQMIRAAAMADEESKVQ